MRKLISRTSLLEESVSENNPVFTVSVSDTSKNFCIGLVDMVNSTKITAKLHHSKAARYYEIFLNSMANVLNKFGGVAVKNMGDSLLFYFPESSHPKRKFGFINCLECSLAMTEEYEKVREELLKEGIPSLGYRVSVDYGFMSVMKSNSTIDLFGTPVNMCVKINRQAPVNGVIIGGDMYQMVKNFDKYYFKEAEAFSIGMKHPYPIYSVRRKHTD